MIVMVNGTYLDCFYIQSILYHMKLVHRSILICQRIRLDTGIASLVTPNCCLRVLPVILYWRSTYDYSYDYVLRCPNFSAEELRRAGIHPVLV